MAIKAAGKKSPAKQAQPKKAAVKKAAVKKVAATKAAARKAPEKKSPVKKTTARKVRTKKSSADTTGLVVVTQVRSTISAKPKTKGTMRALGLRKIGDTNSLPDRPEIRGMLARVPHLIDIDLTHTKTEA